MGYDDMTFLIRKIPNRKLHILPRDRILGVRGTVRCSRYTSNTTGCGGSPRSLGKMHPFWPAYFDQTGWLKPPREANFNSFPRHFFRLKREQGRFESPHIKLSKKNTIHPAFAALLSAAEKGSLSKFVEATAVTHRESPSGVDGLCGWYGKYAWSVSGGESSSDVSSSHVVDWWFQMVFCVHASCMGRWFPMKLNHQPVIL